MGLHAVKTERARSPQTECAGYGAAVTEFDCMVLLA